MYHDLLLFAFLAPSSVLSRVYLVTIIFYLSFIFFSLDSFCLIDLGMYPFWVFLFYFSFSLSISGRRFLNLVGW